MLRIPEEQDCRWPQEGGHVDHFLLEIARHLVTGHLPLLPDPVGKDQHQHDALCS